MCQLLFGSANKVRRNPPVGPSVKPNAHFQPDGPLLHPSKFSLWFTTETVLRIADNAGDKASASRHSPSTTTNQYISLSLNSPLRRPGHESNPVGAVRHNKQVFKPSVAKVEYNKYHEFQR